MATVQQLESKLASCMAEPQGNGTGVSAHMEGAHEMAWRTGVKEAIRGLKRHGEEITQRSLDAVADMAQRSVRSDHYDWFSQLIEIGHNIQRNKGADHALIAAATLAGLRYDSRY